MGTRPVRNRTVGSAEAQAALHARPARGDASDVNRTGKKPNKKQLAGGAPAGPACSTSPRHPAGRPSCPLGAVLQKHPQAMTAAGVPELA